MNSLNHQIKKKVESFYNSMPFNITSSVKDSVKKIQQQNAIMAYPNLHKVLCEAKKTDTILDIGCGAGWFPNTLSYHYSLKCVALDLSKTAVARATEVASRLGVEDKITFHTGDLFLTDFDCCFMIVNSIGVLHHTHDCKAALERISKFVLPGGYLHFALYHKYGRKPFLDYFTDERATFFANDKTVKAEAKKSAFKKYKALNSHIKDETLLHSWCRDQVFHPHETQHTVKDVCKWLSEIGFSPISTSLNGFKTGHSWTELYDEEKDKASLSYELNYIQKKYYPGFFSVLAQKNR